MSESHRAAHSSGPKPGLVRFRVTRAAVVVAVAALLCVVSGMVGPAAAKGGRHATVVSADPDFEWSERLASGQSIEIKGVNGSIVAEPTSGQEVLVTARKHAHHSDPREVQIEINRHAGGVTICAVYPGRGNDCEPGSAGHSHTHNNDVVVDFHVRVPAQAGFVGRTVNGGVEARGLHGRTEAHTVNGSVKIETDAAGCASTVNGSVVATIGAKNWSDALEFGTVNGGVTLYLPATVSAGVSAETVNGSIETDFPLTVKGRIGHRHIAGTIGDGEGGDLKIATVNGSIRLLASR